jgi:hypothetical protein
MLAGCGVSLGPYRAAAFDPYRPRVDSERVAIRTETARPIQWITDPRTGIRVQGIPVNLELSADTDATWADLVDAFRIYETRSLGEGRIERVSAHDVVLLPYQRGDAKLEMYQDVLTRAGSDAARARSLELLQEIPIDGGREETFFLVCRGAAPGEPCVEFGKRYEFHIAPPGVSQFEALEPGRYVQRLPAVYPFRMERRSIPVTIGAGVLLVVGFLTWAAG